MAPGEQAGPLRWHGARNLGTALKSHGVAPKGSRKMSPDAPQPHARLEALGLL